jgi:hypothetical protein
VWLLCPVHGRALLKHFIAWFVLLATGFAANCSKLGQLSSRFPAIKLERFNAEIHGSHLQPVGSEASCEMWD